MRKTILIILTLLTNSCITDSTGFAHINSVKDIITDKAQSLPFAGLKPIYAIHGA